ncbi:hypothetical protein GCM10009665_27200 [Kitasatospora nipponensis]|uniref:Type VII secretion protein EccE n=1 Tax=Kitasatospora nipponensis TaxID=258049 RepID=A0ABP4GWW9_9ACTN
MAASSPDPLAEVLSRSADGWWRLEFIPDQGVEVRAMLKRSSVLPIQLAIGFLPAILVMGVLLRLLPLGGALLAVVLIPLVGLIFLLVRVLITADAEMVRWIDFCPPDFPDRMVLGRMREKKTETVGELRGVSVVEELRLGDRKSIKVVLHAHRTVECVPTVQSPMARVDAPALMAWLSEQLAPFEIPVEYLTDIDRNFECPEEWWPGRDIARLIWRVPEQEFERLAAEHGLEGYLFTSPNEGKSTPEPVLLYNPGVAHGLIEAVRASRN